MGKKSVRCPVCLIPQAFCVCNVVTSINLKTKVTVVVHKSDAYRTTNSGKLIPLVLKNSDVFLRGDLQKPLNMDQVIQPHYHNVVLFPSSKSKLLTKDYINGLEKPMNLIVPDGSWNQAKRMIKREEAFIHLPHIHLNITKPSQYRLRTAPYPHWIATFEAIARSLGVIEGVEVQKRMEYLFDVTVERILFLKGKLSKEEIKGT